MSLPGQLDAFQTVGQRQHEMRLTDADQQPVDNGQGQGKAERDREPRPRITADLDGSAQRLHASPDYVHADAPPGHSVTSRAVENPGARMREKISASESWAAALDQALLDGAGTHRLRIQAAPVVANLDQHLGAGVPGRKANGCRWSVCPAARRASGVSIP